MFFAPPGGRGCAPDKTDIACIECHKMHEATVKSLTSKSLKECGCASAVVSEASWERAASVT